MSFKREGDDLQLLDRLKHKRVNDLLGEHVPEDEAKLLSNGRLTCLICSHRPIFDTMKILVIHRKGKKHTEELHKYLAHKQQLVFKEAKRAQFESLKKEQETNAKVLGAKTNRRKQPHPLKRQTLDITSKDPFGVASVSASSQVRRYLKDISKKTPLSKVVQEQKDSYPEPKQNLNLTTTPAALDNSKAHSQPTGASKSASSTLSIHTSGWKKDRFGNMIKDPEAEFDSSEEET